MNSASFKPEPIEKWSVIVTQVEPSRNNRDDVRVQSDGFKFFLTDKKSQRPVQQAKVKSAEIRARPVGHLFARFWRGAFAGRFGTYQRRFYFAIGLDSQTKFWHWSLFLWQFRSLSRAHPFYCGAKARPGM